MKVGVRALIMGLALAALIISPANSAQSVRILPDISGESVSLNVSTASTGISVSMQLHAMAVNDTVLGGNAYKQIELPGADFVTVGQIAEEGKPDLPALTTSVIIPDQAGVGVTVSYSGYDDIPDFDLAPVQPSPSDTASDPDVPFTFDQQAYAVDAFYPGNLAAASEPQIMRDVRFVQVAMYPAQYNPARRVLRVYRDLEVSINYDGPVVNPKSRHNNYISEGFYPIYKSMFSNFDQVLANTEVKRGGYVIICKAALADSAKAVAQWKHQKGYNVRIVPTTEINSTGSPSQQQIFDYLVSAYQNWDVPPEYVMIIGDVDHNFMVNDWPYSSYPSDHHYSCVDGTDYLSDIFVGRMSIDAVGEARIALSKIIKYEKYPWMGDANHWIRALGVGYTYYESARLTPLWVRQTMLQHGFATVDTVFGSSPDGRIMTKLNDGLGFCFYRGAGSSDGWWGPSLTVTDLQAMTTNQKLGILSPLTCGTGDYGDSYTDPCLGEKWLRMGFNPDSLKGGPGFYGVSEHNTHSRWNNPIMVGFFFGIFNEDIYHLMPAAFRGKMQDYRTFPSMNGRNSIIEQYFNTYNILGDPELELRTKIPTLLRVTYPDSVYFGVNNIDITVADTLGNLIPGAYVTLIKRADTTEEVYSVGKTDDAGHVTMACNARTLGTVLMTVSGRNLYPFQDTIRILDSYINIGLDSIGIDDDEVPPSIGDGDAKAASGETIELSVWLKNFGFVRSAHDVSTTLESLDELTIVYDAVRRYPDISPSQSVPAESPYVIRISPNAFDGQMARLQLTITDQSSATWRTLIEIPIVAPRFIVARAIVLGADTILSPGETGDLEIFISNNGTIDARGVTGYVTTEDDYMKIISSNTSFGDVQVDSMRDNSTALVGVMCDSSTFEGRPVNFALHLSTIGGTKAVIPFTLPIGRIGRNDPLGPDQYGYYMYDSKDSAYACMPTYQWVEISPDSAGGQGTRLNYGSNTDDNSVLVTLPFDFVYYGEPHRALIVCINGFAALDTFRMDSGGHFWANFFNWPMPDPGNAGGQISVLWDDFRITGTHYGVYTWHDTTNHLFYIEWLKMTHTQTSAFGTFQMIIADPNYHQTLTGDSEILFMYNDVNNSDVNGAYASVGFESTDEERGLGYTQDNRYTPGAATLADRLAIRITTNTGRGAIKGIASLGGNDNAGIGVITSLGQTRTTATDGQYWLREVQPGVVNIIASMRGYFPAELDSVTVIANQTIQLDTLRLTQCPIPLNLTATDSLSDRIELQWNAVSHEELLGYNIYRSNWSNGEYVKLNDAPLQSTNFTDATVPDSIPRWYCVTALYAGLNYTVESVDSNKDSGKLLSPTGINDAAPIPVSFFLSQNYPNPFNPTTTISYGIPKDSQVKVEIYNLLGQKVLTLSDGFERAGYKKVVWDGKDSFGSSVTSGVYFYRIDTGDHFQTKKMLLLK